MSRKSDVALEWLLYAAIGFVLTVLLNPWSLMWKKKAVPTLKVTPNYLSCTVCGEKTECKDTEGSITFEVTGDTLWRRP